MSLINKLLSITIFDESPFGDIYIIDNYKFKLDSSLKCIHLTINIDRQLAGCLVFTLLSSSCYRQAYLDNLCITNYQLHLNLILDSVHKDIIDYSWLL